MSRAQARAAPARLHGSKIRQRCHENGAIRNEQPRVCNDGFDKLVPRAVLETRDTQADHLRLDPIWRAAKFRS